LLRGPLAGPAQKVLHSQKALTHKKSFAHKKPRRLTGGAFRTLRNWEGEASRALGGGYLQTTAISFSASVRTV
jgi:hypothetical protein